MSSMNGGISPAPPPDSSTSTPNPSLSAKRKRDDMTEGPNNTNGTPDSKSPEVVEQSVEVAQALIQDLIDVLKADDTTPSILSRSLPERPSSSGPQAKRQKSDDTSETSSSILSRQAAKAYTNVKEVLEDIDTAVADIQDKLQLPNGTARNQFIPFSASQSELSVKATAFKQRAHELIRRELAAMGGSQSKTNASSSNSSFGANISLGSTAFTQINASPGDSRTVLTFYGNAQGNKQLFSSLQIPTKVNGEEKKVLQSIREAGLPNGITTTQIIPIQATGLVDDKKRTPTLGEVFPTPSTVPALQPPKPSKVATTRSSTVGWYQPTANEPVSRSASYSKQSISTGHWLDYSNASPPQQGVKRKQRERALSLVAAKGPSLEPESAESEASKLETLFRGAYSSFAPVKDDSAAVVPAGVMNRIWWQQVGQKNFEKLVENWNDMEDIRSPTPTPKTEEDDEIAMFEKVIAEYENDPIDPSLVNVEAAPEKSAEEKDVEEILEGISDLLETLNSYQRIRHLSLNASSRPAGLLSTPDSTLGTPSKPSEHEQATYEILKSQLTLMISTLPPYAVAKLDPDRLAELSISTKIEIQTNNYKGVMEEDEAASRAKTTAMNATSAAPRPAAPAQPHRSSSATLYGNQYAAPRPSPAPTQQYYGASQSPIRPPATNINMQRPPVASPAPYQRVQQPAGSAPYHPGQAYGTPTYPHQAPRPVSQSYSQPSQQYQQTPTTANYLRAPSQGYSHNLPQQGQQPSNINGRYAGQPQQPGYAHQAQATPNGMGYQYSNGANFNRQVSPQKMYSPQPQNAQPRPNYATPNPSMSQDRRPYIQNAMNQAPMINGSTPRPPSQQQYIPQTPTGYVSHHSNAAQLEIMAQQRANLDAQQETQQRARALAAQSAMGSPPKSQVNGGNPVVAGS
ncbi:hypothetical protein ONS95_014016 [Cadophora gregata]|uniref:uncharacterized protein n=1 Tax=Cadophora gregata TaxID=51156 RepID=UPI0026DB714B|nr:uncharacterized protein ONS95_014016 [Cadophora gregata]KAK0113766.1 hypothetical protein ONS96_014621 [Cadophora gregata f. sp. sojae]KAK0114526.1 hypothetical protein ONS95_014016 [Cadophora gregata]